MNKEHRLSRRKMIRNTALLSGVGLLPNQAWEKKKQKQNAHQFKYCLNTSTIMGQNLGIVQEIEIAAKAGYDGIEIWINSLEKYVATGGKLADLKKRTNDLGIKIENAIGFAQWIVDDDNIRAAALEQAKREMDLLAQIGCPRIAAPPAGATEQAGLDLTRAAKRFKALMDLGTTMSVIPQLEVWGFSKNLSRLSEVLFVATECGHPNTKILPDVYHLFKGGSDLNGLKILNPKAVDIFHLNDYPSNFKREDITDKDRIYPSDGVAPIADIVHNLIYPNGKTILSLELFNRDYWQKDALSVATIGLEKMKVAVEK